jgi:hypothetical protein
VAHGARLKSGVSFYMVGTGGEAARGGGRLTVMWFKGS